MLGMSETLNFSEIHHAFAETDYGKTLAGRVRYERYKPVGVSNDRWIELLGADVNNLSHMPLTYGLAKSFVRHTRELQPDLLNDHEADVLMVAALVHDWGESVGEDITYSDKTDSDEAEEREQFGTNLWSFYGGDTEEIKNLIQEALSDVVFSQDTKLGEMFNAVERAGYVRTALRATEHIQRGSAADSVDGLRWLVADVFGNNIAKLIEHAEKYPALEQYLVNQSDSIAAAFGLVMIKDFLNYAPERQEEKEMAFVDAYTKWSRWTTSGSMRD
jgi:hypothetical protein